MVARFGLFLQALQVSQSNLSLRGSGISPWLGTALIFAGNCRKYIVRRRARSSGSAVEPKRIGSRTSISSDDIALRCAPRSRVAMAIYLVSLRDPQPIHIGNAQETFMTLNLD